MATEPASEGVDLALEFVRFCYRRRPVGWPLMYDEMSIVASHGYFRGLGYADLAERGISLCLTELPRLAELTRRVVAEETASAGPLPMTVEPLPELTTLTLVPATG